MSLKIHSTHNTLWSYDLSHMELKNCNHFNMRVQIEDKKFLKREQPHICQPLQGIVLAIPLHCLSSFLTSMLMLS